MSDGRCDIIPCVDCKWRMLILRGKPTVIIYCQKCRKWFVSDDVHYEDEDTVRAVAKGVSEHVNELLRCDAMAPHIIVARVRACGVCSFTAPEVRVDPGPHGRFDHFIEEIITRQIANPESDIYTQSALPAYTLQRRCGADPRLQELYLKLFPDKKSKVQKYQEQRDREQERFKKRHPDIAAKQEPDEGRGRRGRLAQLGLPVVSGGDDSES